MIRSGRRVLRVRDAEEWLPEVGGSTYPERMTTTPPTPRTRGRRSIRHPDHDYAGPCWYHVTVCAEGRGRRFGSLGRGMVRYTSLGELVSMELQELRNRFPWLRLDAFIVMPDHLHVLIRIWPTRLLGRSGQQGPRQFGGSQARALSLAINHFKGSVTKAARKLAGDPNLRVWHRGYHERIIRTRQQMAATRAYIRNNPIRG